MGKTMIVTIAGAAGMLGLLLLVGDMPGAGIARLLAVKAAGAAMIWAAAKVAARVEPEETAE